MSWLNTPAGLLITVGALLGLNFPLARLAQQAGVPVAVWAAVLPTGSALILGGWWLTRRRAVVLDVRHLRYFAVNALLSAAVPGALVMTVIGHLGSGLTAMLFALSPLLTALLATALGLRRPSRPEWAGIAIGMVGALLVAAARGEVGRPAAPLWLALGLLIPCALALGNVYRTLDWPPGAEPTWLSIGTQVAAAAMLALMVLAGGGGAAGVATLGGIGWVVLAQVAAGCCFVVLYFRLQEVGGPVTLSQIGVVGAGVAVAIGAAAFGERYPPQVWLGLALIVGGVGLTAWARRHG